MDKQATKLNRGMSEALSAQAARIASLAAAAGYLLSGSSPADLRVTETLVIDLMDCAGILAAQLSDDAEALERQAKGL